MAENTPGLPPEHFDLVLEGVLLPLEGLLVDDLDGVHLPGPLLALGQAHHREGPPETSGQRRPARRRSDLRAQQLLQVVLVLDGGLPVRVLAVLLRLLLRVLLTEQRHLVRP